MNIYTYRTKTNRLLFLVRVLTDREFQYYHGTEFSIDETIEKNNTNPQEPYTIEKITDPKLTEIVHWLLDCNRPCVLENSDFFKNRLLDFKRDLLGVVEEIQDLHDTTYDKKHIKV